MAQELKVYRDPKEGPCWREFYEKSEVDAVLAEKDKEIAQLKDKLQAWATHCRMIRGAK